MECWIRLPNILKYAIVTYAYEYTYICVCVCVCVFLFIYIYISVCVRNPTVLSLATLMQLSPVCVPFAAKLRMRCHREEERLRPEVLKSVEMALGTRRFCFDSIRSMLVSVSNVCTAWDTLWIVLSSPVARSLQLIACSLAMFCSQFSLLALSHVTHCPHG